MHVAYKYHSEFTPQDLTLYIVGGGGGALKNLNDYCNSLYSDKIVALQRFGLVIVQ